MNKDFVPYAEALALYELGFDEKCFGWYLPEIADKGNIPSVILGSYVTKWNKFGDRLSAPTFSQAFRWFREKYDLNAISPTRIYATDDYLCTIIDWNNWSQIHFPEGLSISYEEAELKCLKKLIEICIKWEINYKNSN
jgi:hypothetical protein